MIGTGSSTYSVLFVVAISCPYSILKNLFLSDALLLCQIRLYANVFVFFNIIDFTFHFFTF